MKEFQAEGRGGADDNSMLGREIQRAVTVGPRRLAGKPSGETTR
jgi:hypothetical protein